MAWDYSKLRGRIREKCDTQEEFAKKIGLSKSSLSQKLNCRVEFSHSEMYLACEILGIDVNDISLYFFAPKVKKNSTN